MIFKESILKIILKDNSPNIIKYNIEKKTEKSQFYKFHT